jgi:hypothetical protein
MKILEILLHPAGVDLQRALLNLRLYPLELPP